MEWAYVCCEERRECVYGHPAYASALAMLMLGPIKHLSPSNWSKYKYYGYCWKRWWRPSGCALSKYDSLPSGYLDITDLAVKCYAELAEELGIGGRELVENYYKA